MEEDLWDKMGQMAKEAGMSRQSFMQVAIGQAVSVEPDYERSGLWVELHKTVSGGTVYQNIKTNRRVIVGGEGVN